MTPRVTRRPNDIYGIARRIVLLTSAFLSLSSVLVLVNKYFIADPIVRAVTDERVARQSNDSLIVVRLNELRGGQIELGTSIAAAVYSKTAIDAFRLDAETLHRHLQSQIDSLRRDLQARDRYRRGP